MVTRMIYLGFENGLSKEEVLSWLLNSDGVGRCRRLADREFQTDGAMKLFSAPTISSLSRQPRPRATISFCDNSLSLVTKSPLCKDNLLPVSTTSFLCSSSILVSTISPLWQFSTSLISFTTPYSLLAVTTISFLTTIWYLWRQPQPYEPSDDNLNHVVLIPDDNFIPVSTASTLWTLRR